MRMRYSNPPDARLRQTSDPPNRRRRRQSGNIMIMFIMMLPFVLIPLVGLAIDATMLYSVKLKLQTAVDGGALAAVYALSAGQNDTAQKTAAYFAADQFIRANIQAGISTGSTGGYWGAYNFNDSNCTTVNGALTPTGSGIGGGMTYANALATTCFSVSGPVAHVRTVSVVASVNVPLLFMRILGFSSGKVTANGSGTRRDVSLIMVIDRSSSLGAELTALKSGAQTFVNAFSENHDYLGLVLINGSSMVAYPPGDWGLNPPKTVGAGGGATGPDGNFKSTTAPTNLLTTLAAVQANQGNTGMAEGLMLAYYELLASDQTGALNVIVLWTDGSPNGITADFNNTAHNAVKANCKYWTGGTNTSLSATGAYPTTAANSLLGWMAQWGGNVAGINSGHGVFQRMQTIGGNINDWITLDNGNEGLLPNSAGATNCSFASAPNNANVPNDVNIPSVDYYGNSSLGSSAAPYTQHDFTQSIIWNQAGACNWGLGNTGVGPAGGPLNLTGNLTSGVPASADPCQFGLAAWNGADMAGLQIRTDAGSTQTLMPRIFTMGYVGQATGAGGVDNVLLQRLANVDTSNDALNPATGLQFNTVYDSTKPSGMYIQIQEPNDVDSAFQTLLAQILRLSR